MKSFKQYLDEQNLFENEWNFNIPKTKKIEADQKNQNIAKKIINLALGKGNPYAEAFEAIKAKASSGEEVITGEKEIDDILQSLSILSVIASKKNSSSYKILSPSEAKKLLHKAGLTPDESGNFAENPLIKAGNKIISKNRKSSENSEENHEDENDSEELEKTSEILNIKTKEDPKTSETLNIKTKDSDTNKEEEIKPSNKPKDVDLESDNSRSPESIAKRAQEKVDEFLKELESKKEGLDANQLGIIDKAIINFKKKANQEIYNIKKQQQGFSVYPTAASRLKSTTKAEKFYNDLKMLISKARYDAERIYRTSSLQRAGMKAKEIGQGIARGISNLDKKTKGTQEAIKRTVKTAGEKIYQGAKTVSDSKTAQEIKAATNRVWDKIKTKTSEMDKKIAQGISKVANRQETNLEKKSEQVLQNNETNLKTIKNKIENKDSDNIATNTSQAKNTSKIVMDKATLNKILPGQINYKTPLVAKNKKDEEENLKFKTG